MEKSSWENSIEMKINLKEAVFMMFRNSILLLLFILGAAGCASKPTINDEIPRFNEKNEAYEKLREKLKKSDRVAPGNTVMVHYSGDSKVSGTYKVNFDGNIKMPYKIVVKAAGLTTSELAK